MVFIVCDIGSNWCGNVNFGKKLISACKHAGADAVKMQMFRPEDLYSSTHLYWAAICKSELSLEAAHIFKRYADKIGIEWFTSIFYPEPVKFLEALGVKRYKIASRTAAMQDANSQATLEALSRTNKKIIVSTGYGLHPQFTSIFKSRYVANWVFENMQFLYCVPKYPSSIDEIHFSNLSLMNGYSNHIPDPAICLASVVWNRKSDFILETHVTSNRHIDSPDAAFSLTFKELRWLVTNIRKFEVMLN